ncbi:MAG: hypothetical protein ACRDOK_19560 [Streptosporangiaceae bacterium]
MTHELDDEAVSYAAAVLHSPVLASSGATIGHLEHVLEVPELDVFDGIVCSTHHGLRFIDADHVTRITRTSLQTDLSDAQAAGLPAPTGPPVYHVDALQNSGSSMHDVLGRFFGRPHWIREHD